MVEIKSINSSNPSVSITIIDLGYAKFVGEAPYPHHPHNILIKYCHTDPSLSDGGMCSIKTDYYSFGHLLQQIYELTKCNVYKRASDLLCSGNENSLSLTDLLQSNCNCS